MLRTLIIEDNAAARADLRDRLKAHPAVAITGEVDSVGRARPLLARGDYDLVFLDVELRGGDAFELVPLVVAPARVIFVTAHAEYAVRAFDVDAADYLLKPVVPERLAACLAKITRQLASTPADAPLHSAPIATDDGTRLVAFAEIAAIFAEQNYTAVWRNSGEHHLVRRTLKDWEETLPAAQFIRTARDSLVNLAHVVRVERRGEKGAWLWVTGCVEPVRASNRQASVVRAALTRRAAL